MKITTTKKPNKKYLTALVIAGIIVISATAFAWQAGYFDGQSESIPPTTDVTEKNKPQDNSDNKKSTDDTQNTKSSLPGKQDNQVSSVSQHASGASTETDSSLRTPSIERASQSGDNVKIVAGFPSPQSGVCEVTFSRSGSPSSSYQSPITVSPSNYSCSFVIPTSSFPTDGSWQISLVQRVDNQISAKSNTDIKVVK